MEVENSGRKQYIAVGGLSSDMGKAESIKFESNWLSKSLENLEKEVWPELPADEGSYLIRTCNQLRKKPLKEFSTEDLREMIGQDIGLRYLIPLALQTLEKDILAEGNLYPGDLLNSVLTSDKSFWQKSADHWRMVSELFEKNTLVLKEAETTYAIKKAWFSNYKAFSSYEM